MTRRSLFRTIAAVFAAKNLPAEMGRPCLTINRIEPILSKHRLQVEAKNIMMHRQASVFASMGTGLAPPFKIGDTIQVRKPVRFL